MKTIEQYKAELLRVANLQGIVGDHVDVICSLLSYALYTSSVEKLMNSRELSLTKSTSINSKIQIALDKNYPVYRGECIELELPVIFRTGIDLPANSILYESSDFNLYTTSYVKESESSVQVGDPDWKRNVIRLRLKVSTEFITKKIPTTGSLYFVEVLDKDVEDQVIVKSGGTQYGLTRNFRDHLNNPNLLYNLTIPDFGFRLFCNQLNSVFKDGEVEVSYYKYFKNKELVESRLTYLSILGLEIVRHEDIQPKVIETKDRENSASIESNALSSYYTNSMLRSNTDFTDIISQVIHPDVETTMMEWKDSKLNIYLLPKEGKLINSHITRITEDFRSKIENGYYILPSYEIKEATSHSVVAEVTVYTYLSTQDVNRSEIDRIISSYSRKLNSDINKSQMTAELSRVSGVNYVTVKLLDSSNNELGPKSSRLDQIGPGHYYKIESRISIIPGED